VRIQIRLIEHFLIFLLFLGWASIQAQTSEIELTKTRAFQSGKILLSQQGLFPENFNIRFDLKRLQNLHPFEKDRDNTYYFPDTVVVYSIQENPKKYTYLYSANGERQMTFLKVLENEEWVNKYFIIVTYDSVGNPLVTETRVWQIDTWVFESRITNTYTTNHNILTSISQNWDGASWLNSTQETYTYNVSGKPVALLKEEWLDNNWSNVFYDLYTYDDSGNLTSGIRQSWEIDNWINEQQYTYSYDSNNNMLIGIIELWNTDAWQFFYKESYTYDASNQPIEYIGQFWETDNWVNFEKLTYTYNEYGFVELALSELWTNGNWANNERGHFTQNVYGGVQSALIENWQSDNWVNTMLTTYSHDEFGNTLSANLFHWFGDTWSYSEDGMMELSYYFGIYSETFIGYLAEASYLTIVTDIPEPFEFSILNLNAFPNPATRDFTVSIQSEKDTQIDLRLYNMNGVQINAIYDGWMKAGESSFKVETNNLPAGMYYARLYTGSQTKYLKIILTQ
jgi:hypothetical protein